ncbi:transglycosylase SLT domain-containing protein [Xenorhabdus bovienii]|uniref:transglycosylase SLT domain-containing protein n=1 Tax=Xenorhabdus bovienii TaxID=40576 RepID=UPI00237D019A|nr:transglycosylase SLT domain-containing protein [Xenorhabdus bovienii]MDE1485135.1 transglycosylase SLT domain-containing protein [Xenorhabdus bovienii]MDE9475998.1 transglycosylase SLT domain-containing protein [Xenorhabdus bovienii]MDE9528767.1 transglycosylase SLT domain-containing protein [Xenorhabdus bovienii]
MKHLSIGFLFSGLLFVSLNCVSSQQVPQGYHQVAQAENVPAEALYSVALAESSYKLPQGVRPWPWTINVAGKGYRYRTRLEAWQSLQSFMKTHSTKRIDVGIAQVNLGWNGHNFNSTWEAFDPYINLHVAARILRSCYDSNPGSWVIAAGCYHHPKGGLPASKYKSIVKQKLSTLTLALATERSEAPVKAEEIWIEPEVK